MIINPKYACNSSIDTFVHLAYFSPPIHVSAYLFVLFTISCRSDYVKNSINASSGDEGTETVGPTDSVNESTVTGM